MRAVLLKGYGDVNQLELADVPDPKPGPGEVLVRVRATSINPIDFKLRSGAMKAFMPLPLPYILGRDVAGEVAQVGENVTEWHTGDRVMGLVNNSYAEYLTAKADLLTAIPADLLYETAGALPLILLTGSQLIEDGVKPNKGETILVTGAVGSVGRTAVHVAKQHGAVVFAGVKASQLEEAAELQADGVISLDASQVEGLPELDAIADTVGDPVLPKVLGHLKKGGRVASVLGEPDTAKKAGVKVIAVLSHPDASRLHKLAEEIARHEFTIPIARIFRLDQIHEAQTVVEQGIDGKVVVVP